MRPYDAKTDDDLISMESDNHPGETGQWSILHNGGHVSLHAPEGRGYISIPRDQFNVIVDWYVANQPQRREPSE